MSLETVPGAGNVVRFPRERRSEPEDATLHDIAPPHALVASILEERELPAADIHAAFREATARQALLLESQLGREATILQLRAALDGHMAQALLACRQYQAAADAMIRLEVRAEAVRRTVALAARAAQGRGGAGTDGVPRPGARRTRRGGRGTRLCRRARALYPERARHHRGQRAAGVALGRAACRARLSARAGRGSCGC